MNALNINSSHSPTKVVTTSQPDYLHNLIFVQSTCKTRSSSAVTVARLSVSSSLQITNCSFTYASPYLWNQLPSSFRQPHSVHCPPDSHHPAHITPSQSSPSLSPSITPSTFHSRLKTHLFHKSLLHFCFVAALLSNCSQSTGGACQRYIRLVVHAMVI